MLGWDWGWRGGGSGSVGEFCDHLVRQVLVQCSDYGWIYGGWCIGYGGFLYTPSE